MGSNKKEDLIDTEEQKEESEDTIYLCSKCEFCKFMARFGIVINHSNCWIECDDFVHECLSLDDTFKLLNECIYSDSEKTVLVYPTTPISLIKNKNNKSQNNIM